jgi:hypothetical protein
MSLANNPTERELSARFNPSKSWQGRLPRRRLIFLVVKLCALSPESCSNLNGFDAIPVGFAANPVGFMLWPVGFGPMPMGFAANPTGFAPNPVGFESNTVGFVPFPWS